MSFYKRVHARVWQKWPWLFAHNSRNMIFMLRNDMESGKLDMHLFALISHEWCQL